MHDFFCFFPIGLCSETLFVATGKPSPGCTRGHLGCVLVPHSQHFDHSGSPGSPDDVHDDEIAEPEEPGGCAELNACKGELSACADLTDVLQALTQGIETRKG